MLKLPATLRIVFYSSPAWKMHVVRLKRVPVAEGQPHVFWQRQVMSRLSSRRAEKH